MNLKDQINQHVRKAEETIKFALQTLHDATGLTPISVHFTSINIRTWDQQGIEKAVLISDVDIKANT